MSDRKAKAARQAQNGVGDQTAAARTILETDAPQELQYPAVIVMRKPTGQPGQERIEIAEVNGIDSLSIPTLLRMAAKVKENQLGVGE